MTQPDASPLTTSQLHLWKSQAISPDVPLFNQVITVELAWTLSDRPNISRLQQAWERVLVVHPVLNQVIHTDPEGTPYQHQGNCRAALDIIDFQAESSGDEHHNPADGAISAWIEQRKLRPFTLEHTLVDAALLRVDKNRSVFFLNMHHLIADAWSTMQVWRALEMEYFSPGSLYDSEPGFGDYVSATKAHQTTGPTNAVHIGSKQKSPARHARQPAFYGVNNHRPSTESSRQILPLDEPDWQQLVDLARDPALRQLNQNLFLFCVHMTALAIFVHRTTQDETIVIESPLLGRFDPKWKNTVGNFIEMARFEITLNPGDSIREVYLACRTRVFETLKSARPGMTAQLQSGPVHAVLNIITAQKHTVDGGQGLDAHTQIEWHHTGHSDTHHPLRLHVADWNGTGRPTLSLDINRAFFPADNATSVVQHLHASYRGLFADREKPISAIPLLQDHERWSFAGASVPAPAGSTVLQLIDQQAQSCADQIALRDGTDSLSYQQMAALAQTVCKALQARNIGAGDRVAVCLPRCLRLPAILLGILRSGAAFIPIDINQPSLRVLDILTDAQVACTMMEPEQAALFPAMPPGSAQIVPMSELFDDPLIQQSGQPAAITASPDDPAYLIYTSGSTGTPKGVVITHGALMNYLRWGADYYQLTTPIVMPLFTSIGFDLTITSFFLPLLDAGTVRIFTQHADADRTGIFDVIRDPSINTVKLTPAHLSLLNEQDLSGSGIQQLIVGGEDLKSALAQRVQSRFAHPLRIINEYGPTEATVGSIARQWNETDPATGSVPIGLPINNLTAYVLNEAQLPQLEGLAGELYISGPSLAQRYWNDPDLTSTAFLDNPWKPGHKMYRTGDQARIVSGELTYLGRNDSQLKINGYRIDIAEIESALLSHPAVTECVVLASETKAAPAISGAQRFCVHCGLSSHHPDAKLNEDNVCSVCINYGPVKSKIDAYFKSMDDLTQLVNTIKSCRADAGVTEFDAVVLLSGGKDSTYTLCKLVELGLNVCALSLDNGFLSDQAKANIRLVCDALQVEHHYASTPAMDQIFADSLDRYSNVCHGCFKTIYTLSLKFAAERSIGYIFTGLSRGQLFETRLSNELFSEPDTSGQSIDSMVKAARVQYHAIADAPNTLLNIREVNEGSLVEKIEIIDFYRYCHVEMSDMLSYIHSRTGWVRPPDTGRSTNCLINDVGIHVHKLERGFHNYSLPYSWDVRLGHKERAEALEELDDDINTENVDAILQRIGYTPKNGQAGVSGSHTAVTQLSAHYTAQSAVDEDELGRWTGDRLPSYMRPRRYIQRQQIPLNANGKIDRAQLRDLLDDQLGDQPGSKASQGTGRSAETAAERLLIDIWKDHVQSEHVHADDNFFELGGDSLSAIRCVMQLRRLGYTVEPADLFRQPCLEQFAKLLDQQNATRKPEQKTKKTEKFANLGETQKARLAKLLKQNNRHNNQGPQR